MNNAKHEWCRDTERDEAVRAAEDAAAVPAIMHRDLPEIVAELRERVAGLMALVGKAAVAGVFDSVGVPPSPATRPGETEQPGRVQSQAEPWKWYSPLPSSCGALHPTPDAQPEQVALLWASVADILGRVVRIEGEIDAGKDEARRQSAAWDGARQAYSDAIKRLTAERDAARAECERLSAANRELDRVVNALESRVGELKAAAKTTALLAEMRESEWNVASELAAEANAENAGAGGPEPLRWEVVRHSAAAINLDDHAEAFAELERERPEMDDDGRQWANAALEAGRYAITRLTAESNAARAECERLRARVAELEDAKDTDAGGKQQEPVAWGYAHPNGTLAFASAQEPEPGTPAIVPLYAAPPEPRGWLTAEDRRAVAFAAKVFRGHTIVGPLKENADQLDALLARSSPPRVRRPVHAGTAKTALGITVDCDHAWIAAIRAAGVEVEG